MTDLTARSESPTLSNCAEKWIRMNDMNCKATVNWYKACADLANQLNGEKRESYGSALIENVKTSSDNYFKTSKKPLSTLSLIQKELSGVVERLLFPPDLTKNFDVKPQRNSDWSSYYPTNWNLDSDTIMKAIFWLGVITAILTVVILVILFLYCLQYRKMKERISKKDPCCDIGEFQCGPSGCECTRRLWDTGEPRKPVKQTPVVECDTSDMCDSDQEIGLRFTVQSSCNDDSSYKTPQKKSLELRRHSRTNQ